LILLLGLLTCKTVSQITYTVLVETLNPAQSINYLLTLTVLAYIVVKHDLPIAASFLFCLLFQFLFTAAVSFYCSIKYWYSCAVVFWKQKPTSNLHYLQMQTETKRRLWKLKLSHR